ncbi:MAG: zinc ABC transporter substrate-binding protein [Candidatus Hydrogenedentes bacterium]|nr:zinc ABC transporter substrate-binding protein [Candidatus Hydrogenedentota bacterium]
MRAPGRFILLSLIVCACSFSASNSIAAEAAPAPLQVVATLPDYAVFAEAIGGERVAVSHIVQGDQDAHFIRPKPSFVNMVRTADVLVATGLDLELWLSTVVDKSGNRDVRSGQVGYVAAAQGMTLLEKPASISRAEGGVHIYGNPHVTNSPIQMRIAARNIATGLIKNDPAGKAFYQERLAAFLHDMDAHLFGEKLVDALGGDTLVALADKGTLISFLEGQQLDGAPLIESLGGWMHAMRPLRGTAIVTYHKNWVYFLKLFGMEEAGTVEPKPGIPPSPRHVTELVEMMRERDIRIILAANYFDEQKIRTVASRVDAEAVIVPLYVGGAPGVTDYFKLMDCWVEGLLNAADAKGLIGEN